MAISTVSIANTPQAKGDTYDKTEDQLSGIYTLDVMSNDLGGNAKTLWSLDNTATDGALDLIASDIGETIANTDDTSLNGAKIWIENGKVRYDTASLTLAFRNAINALGVGDTITDSFTYAIRLGNGTLAWTTATIVYSGTNDGVVIGAGNFTGSVTEEELPTRATGSFAFGDVDLTDVHTVSVAANGSNYLGTLNALISNDSTGDGAGTVNWRFNVDNAAIQYLGQGETLTQTYTITVDDGEGGSDSETVTITIIGDNDDVQIAAGGTVAGVVTEDSADFEETGSFGFTDVDFIDGHTASATPDAAGYVGTLTAEVANDSTGDGSGEVEWTFNVDNDDIQFLGEGDSLVQTYTVTVDDGEGGSATQTITVTIHGTNDDPVISVETGDSAAESLTETNGVIGVSGTLTVIDPDTSDTVAVEVASMTADGDTNGMAYATLAGMLTLDTASLAADSGSDGNLGWTFSSGAADAFDYLSAGESLVLTYTVQATDDEGVVTTRDIIITVTGTNDAAVLSADVRDLVETDDAADLGTSGTLTISDVDSDEEFVAQAGTAGTYGTFSIDAAGAWTYVATSAHDEFEDGVVYTDTFTVESADGTTTTVTINITGTNDAAVLSADVRDLVETDDAADLGTSGTLTISDVDSDEEFVAQAGTAGTYGTFSIDAAGAWTYVATSAHDEFEDGVVYTDTFTVESADGTTTTVTINITGTNDAAVLSADVRDLVETDDAADLGTSGTLTISDVDSDEEFVAQAGTAGTYGTFSIDAAGAWTYVATSAHDEFEDGVVYTDTFTVESADGTTTTVTINITGTNDAAVITGATTGTVDEDAVPNTATGDLHAADVDNPADSWNAVAGATNSANGYGTFTLTAAGVWTYTLDNTDPAVNALVGSAILNDSFTVSTVDGTSQTVTITITASNDGATITADADGDYTLVESGGVGEATPGDSSAGGDLDVSDVDTGQAIFQTPSAAALIGLYGTFTFDASTGAWSYTLANGNALTNELNDGESQAETLTVTSLDGTDSHDIVVVIYGTNDASYITGDTSGSVTEAGAAGPGIPTVEGNLSSQDVDNEDEQFVVVDMPAASTGGYGTYTVDNLGNWDYFLSNGNAAVQALNVGATLIDTFTVYSIDNTPQVITITINGANDAAVISGPSTGTVVEATPGNGGGTPQASGTLLADDVDNPDNQFSASSGGTSFGSFVMTTAGLWTYTLDNANATVNALNTGQSLADSFVVSSVDGTTHTVSVTINGATDAQPVVNIKFVPNGTDFNGSLPAAGQQIGSFVAYDAAGAIIPGATFSVTAGSTGTLSVASDGTVTGGLNNNDVFNFSVTSGDVTETVHVESGTGGVNTITGSGSIDILFGFNNNDTLNGGTNDDTLYGQDNNDTLNGGDNDDFLIGGANVDNLNGQNGNDYLRGGSGNDVLSGGSGNDRFVFTEGGGNDTITDLVLGTDNLDFSAVDANSNVANDQAFVWGGTTATANGLWFAVVGGNTVIRADTDGNAATVEFTVTLQGGPSLAPYSAPGSPPADWLL